ncbi:MULTISPECIES: hypothetical protein [unclassified Pseudoxanthomonas]|jgi:hypothetical protein|uniref:hypothetical protein n=1 Tax=unclassified Pseudoxanthomonas TaxID=2645906 RepID=UPI0030779AA7
MKHAPFPSFPALTLLLLGGIATSATAQNQVAPSQPQPSAQQAITSTAAASGGDRSVTLQESSGPVTVTWGQPRTLPNAADYQAKVADLDRNGDGVLTRAEVPPEHALSSEFKLVDRNHDGRITAAELQNWR